MSQGSDGSDPFLTAVPRASSWQLSIWASLVIFVSAFAACDKQSSKALRRVPVAFLCWEGAAGEPGQLVVPQGAQDQLLLAGACPGASLCLFTQSCAQPGQVRAGGMEGAGGDGPRLGEQPEPPVLQPWASTAPLQLWAAASPLDGTQGMFLEEEWCLQSPGCSCLPLLWPTELYRSSPESRDDRHARLNVKF